MFKLRHQRTEEGSELYKKRMAEMSAPYDNYYVFPSLWPEHYPKPEKAPPPKYWDEIKFSARNGFFLPRCLFVMLPLVDSIIKFLSQHPCFNPTIKIDTNAIINEPSDIHIAH